MALVAPNVGETAMLGYIVNKTTQDDLKLWLYSNNETLDEDTVVGDLTESIEYDGEKTLTGSSWSIATGTASYASQTFTFSGSEDIYGYYVTDNAGTTLLWAEEFSGAPYSMTNGGTIEVTLNISLS